MSWIEERSLTPVRGLSLAKLGVDQAYLNVTSHLKRPAWLYWLAEPCVQCPFERVAPLVPGATRVLTMGTGHGWKLRAFDHDAGQWVSAKNSSGMLCGTEESFWDLGEFGVYDLLVEPSDGSDVKCSTSTVHEPVSILAPFLLMVTLLVLGIVAWNLVRVQLLRRITRHLSKYHRKDQAKEKSPMLMEDKPKRILSLDGFRGACLVLMMMKHDGAGGYSVLDYGGWDKLGLADVVLPWFQFIMGVCIPLAMRSQIKRGISKKQILAVVFRRSVQLFLLGLVLNSVVYTEDARPHLSKLRIFNVLQRLAIHSFLVSALFLMLWPANEHTSRLHRGGPLRDIAVLWPQWAVVLSLQVLHLAVVYLMPVPGCPTGYLGPGGRSEDGKYMGCGGGAMGYLDRLLLGVDHLSPAHTARSIYGALPFDPEGPSSIIPSLMSTFIGIQTGVSLVAFEGWRERLIRWTVWAVVCIAGGALLEPLVPVNKNLWSVSFTLLTSGFAFLVLIFSAVMLDVWGKWRGAPLTYVGMNSILMYAGHFVLYKTWPWHWAVGRMDTHFVLLLETLWGLGVWMAIATYLFKKKIFIAI